MNASILSCPAFGSSASSVSRQTVLNCSPVRVSADSPRDASSLSNLIPLTVIFSSSPLVQSFTHCSMSLFFILSCLNKEAWRYCQNGVIVGTVTPINNRSHSSILDLFYYIKINKRSLGSLLMATGWLECTSMYRDIPNKQIENDLASGREIIVTFSTLRSIKWI